MTNIKINLFEALIMYRTVAPHHYGAPEGWQFYQRSEAAFKTGLITNAYIKQNDETIVVTFQITNGIDVTSRKFEEMKAHAKKFIQEVNSAAERDGYDRVAVIIGFERSAGIARFISKECDIIPIVFDRVSNNIYAESDTGPDSGPVLVKRWLNFFNTYPEVPQIYLDQFIADKSMLWVQQQLNAEQNPQNLKRVNSGHGFFANDKNDTATIKNIDKEAGRSIHSGKLKQVG
jgi:hypothetical protein